MLKRGMSRSCVSIVIVALLTLGVAPMAVADSGGSHDQPVSPVWKGPGTGTILGWNLDRLWQRALELWWGTPPLPELPTLGHELGEAPVSTMTGETGDDEGDVTAGVDVNG